MQNNLRPGEELIKSKIKAKIRFDFKGVPKPSRLFFGGKSTEKVAEETREQHLAVLRNVPIQGIRVEDIDITGDVYVINDPFRDEDFAYAPLELTVSADSVEDLTSFVVREEFRRIEILEPGTVTLTNQDVEKLLFKTNQESRDYIDSLIRRVEGK